jgi:hypothetical protein
METLSTTDNTGMNAHTVSEMDIDEESTNTTPLPLPLRKRPRSNDYTDRVVTKRSKRYHIVNGIDYDDL